MSKQHKQKEQQKQHKQQQRHYEKDSQEDYDEAEEGEEEERGINIEDLDIIDNNNTDWEPTDQQIEFYARKINFDVDNEPSQFLEIAYKYLTVELPQDWQRAFDKRTGELFYLNLSTQEIDDITELEERAYKEYIQYKKQYIKELQKQKQKNKGRNDMEDNDEGHKENIAFDEDDDQEQEEDADERGNKKVNIETLDPPQGEEGDGDGSNDNIIIHATENSRTSSKISAENIGVIDDSNDNDDIDVQDIKPVGKVKTANQPQIKDDNQLKKEYRNYKQKELGEFHNELKEILSQSIKDYQNKSIEEYERKLLSEKRKFKDDIEKYYNEHLDTNENLFKEEYLNDIREYKEFIRKEAPKPSPVIPSEEDISLLNSLENEKTDLLNKISTHKTNQSNKTSLLREQLKSTFKEQHHLNKERLLIQKEFLDKKHECLMNQLEKDYELRFQREKSSITSSQTFNKKKPSDQVTTMNIQPILNEYQKMLDELFIIKTKEIKGEFEHDQFLEVNDYTQSALAETNQQIALINQSIVDLEKDYYEELEQLRTEQRKTNHKRSEEIKESIRSLPGNFDSIKQRIIGAFDREVNEVIRMIHQSILSKKDYDGIEYPEEGKCEEMLVAKGSEANVAFQKSKAMYDLIEKEYKEKEVLLRYFIDVSGGLTRKLIESPMIDNERSAVQNTIDELLMITKEKVSEYSMKGRTIKERKLFPFMDLYIEEMNMMLKGSNGKRNSFEGNRSMLLNSSAASKGRVMNKGMEESKVSYRDYSKAFSPVDDHNDKDNANDYNSSERLFKLSSPEGISVSASYRNANNNINMQSIPNGNDLLLFSQSQGQAQSQAQSYSKPQDSELILSLPKEITSTLSNADFANYSRIIDFILQETSSLNQEHSLLSHQTDLNNQLTQINENGDLLQLSHIFIEEKAKTIRIEQRHKSKSDLFLIIKSHINDVFTFIISNSSRTDVLNEKFQLLLKHIDDYNKYTREYRKSITDSTSLSTNVDILRNSRINVREIDSGAYNNFYAYHHHYQGKSN